MIQKMSIQKLRKLEESISFLSELTNDFSTIKLEVTDEISGNSLPEMEKKLYELSTLNRERNKILKELMGNG
jgi:hypothetical protein